MPVVTNRCTSVQADTTQVERLLARGEAKLREYAHPDPYIGESRAVPLSEFLSA